MVLQVVAEPARGRGVAGALVQEADMLDQGDMDQERLGDQRLARIDVSLGVTARGRCQ